MKRKFESKNKITDLVILFTILGIIFIAAFVTTLNTIRLNAKSSASTIQTGFPSISPTDSPTIPEKELIFNDTNNETSEEIKGLILDEGISDKISPMNKLNLEISKLIELYKSKGMEKISIFIKDVKTSETIQVNVDEKLPSASLYKLFVLWKVQEEINAGSISDSTLLTLNATNDASDDDGYKLGEYGSTITVEYARKIMVINSNNTASLALAQKVGWGNIQSMLNKNGFSNTIVSAGLTKQTSANNINKFLDGILNQNLSPNLKPSDYDLMLGLLKQQKIQTNLNPGLPKEAIFAHKTGNVYDYIHDAGILYLPDGQELIITAMTKGNTSTGFSFLKSLGQLIWKNYSES